MAGQIPIGNLLTVAHSIMNNVNVLVRIQRLIGPQLLKITYRTTKAERTQTSLEVKARTIPHQMRDIRQVSFQTDLETTPSRGSLQYRQIRQRSRNRGFAH